MPKQYEKKGQILEEADRFLYLEELYLMFPRRIELYKSQEYWSKTPIKGGNSRTYSESHSCYIQRYWELLAAPKQWLINEGFKLKL